jgi:hypothetical protein
MTTSTAPDAAPMVMSSSPEPGGGEGGSPPMGEGGQAPSPPESTGGSDLGGSSGLGGAPLEAGGSVGVGGLLGGTGGSFVGGAGGGMATDESFDIGLEYRYDTKAAFDELKRGVMDEAAASWSRYIASEFPDIPVGTAVRTRHPELPNEDGMVYTLEYAIDDFVLVLGFGIVDGPMGNLATTSKSFTNQVADTELLERLRVRDEGPVYQPWIAQTTFDEEEDWFVDPTPQTDDDLPAEQSDMLSTAIHEIGHALGFANSNAFDALVDNGTFVGPTAMDLHGGPVPLSPDNYHFITDTMSAGATPVMEAGTKNGERKRPTPLDLAVLEDIGYEIRWELVP